MKVTDRRVYVPSAERRARTADLLRDASFRPRRLGRASPEAVGRMATVGKGQHR
jgi:hypothetical protein